MTILCDEDGKFEIQHWPPLCIDDTVAISKILEVRIYILSDLLRICIPMGVGVFSRQ